MKILALETATPACSVALNLDGEIIEHYELAERRHASDLLPMAEKLLAQAGLSLNQLDGIAFGHGPGAFTGLRVAVATAQGLAFAVDLPVMGISTLAALAQYGFREHGATAVLSAMDARMDEIYWGAYHAENGIMVPVIDDVVIAPSLAHAPDERKWLGIGNGWQFVPKINIITDIYYNNVYPHAHDVALLAHADVSRGQFVAPELARPVYLRDKVALKISER